MKERLLGCSNLNYIKTFKYFESFKEDFKKNNKFLSYLRFLEYQGDLKHIAAAYIIPPVLDIDVCIDSRRKLKMPAISIENEKLMLKRLTEIVETCLNKYPQTYEEDLELLKTDLSYNERNCVIYRMGEKKIYKQMLEMAKVVEELLGMTYQTALEQYNLIESTILYAPYIKKIILPLLIPK